MDEIIKEFLAATQQDLNQLEEELRDIQAGKTVSEEILDDPLLEYSHDQAQRGFRGF